MNLVTSLDLAEELLFHDLFCGAGGASIGLSAAGFKLAAGLNHWERAIETHSANFTAEHIRADASNYDMRRLPRARFLWASPICTEVSPSGGNKKLDDFAQMDLLSEEEADTRPRDQEAYVRTRATFHDVIRATEVWRYLAVIVENVVDVIWKWPLFDWWVDGMRQLGYNPQFVSVSSAHVGDEDNPHAPQWRDRLYIVFTRQDIPLPDVAPRPLAYCPTCDQVVRSVQAWKNPRKRKVGKYGQQYVYRCPNISPCRNTIVEPYVRPAAAAIDWSDLGTPVGERKRPLVPSTRRRIGEGYKMFAQPTVVAHHGQTYERPGSGYVRAWPALQAPFNARTATQGDALSVPPFTVPSGGTWREKPDPVTAAPMAARTASESDGLVCPPFVMNTNHGKHDSGRQFLPHAAPLPTRSTKIGEGVVIPPFVTMLRRNGTATGIEDPLATLAASGNHHGLAVPDGAFLSKHHGGLDYPRIEHMNKSVADPAPTVVAKPNVSLVIPYRRGAKPHRPGDQPLSTVATVEQHALATSEAEQSEFIVTDADIDACLFRMLKPREHLAAQRFPGSYVVKGTNTEQTMQAGNAVSSNVSQWLGAALMAVLQ